MKKKSACMSLSRSKEDYSLLLTTALTWLFNFKLVSMIIPGLLTCVLIKLKIPSYLSTSRLIIEGQTIWRLFWTFYIQDALSLHMQPWFIRFKGKSSCKSSAWQWKKMLSWCRSMYKEIKNRPTDRPGFWSSDFSKLTAKVVSSI